MIKPLFEKVFACFGCYSAIATIFGNKLNQPINIISIIIISIYFIFSIKEWWLNKPLVYGANDPKQQEKINQFMRDWIVRGQKIAIFSNDMSWVQDASEVKKLLISKAKKDEVEIFLPKENALSKELAQKGAKVYAYDKDFQPLIRFTVINRGRDDAKVAIGRRNKAGDFQIEKYLMGHDATCALANDILNVIQRSQGAQHNGQSTND
jgi:hypothetical protein